MMGALLTIFLGAFRVERMPDWLLGAFVVVALSGIAVTVYTTIRSMMKGR